MIAATWTPREEQARILDIALEHVRSVPYAVSARWLFYRLLGSVYRNKDDYKSRFLPLVAKARKQFYGGWHPDTLNDDTRDTYRGPDGYESIDDFVSVISRYLRYDCDKWINQDYYIELWFEAKAMRGQFEYYTEEILLMPFGGDISIPAKSSTAKRLTKASETYGKEIVILYFGDDDPKGQQIPYSALKDIRAWCSVDFQFIRCGLNEGDAEVYGIPENPDKPGTYQWEALTDDQANEIITEGVAPYFNRDTLEEDRERDDQYSYKIQETVRAALDGIDWDQIGNEDEDEGDEE